MYIPSAFREDDPAVLREMIAAARLAHLVTATEGGLVATPLPLLFEPNEGPHGTLYGHVARANPHWQAKPLGQALTIIPGPDAYVSPSFYASKKEHGRVVPTWNYTAVHAYGEVEFFEDAARLLELVSKLTDHHEQTRAAPWAVADAPTPYIASQLRAIVGFRLQIARLEGKRKLSQNRSEEDRAGVAAGLEASSNMAERDVARTIPLKHDKPD